MYDHHAILLLGPHPVMQAEVPEDCRQESSDVHLITCEAFSIDDARALSERANNRPVSASKRRFVITTQEILREAQHALLKLFEDPPATAQFYVLLEDDRGLLPTLRSRFHIIERVNAEPEETTAEAFLQVSYQERLELIKNRLAEKDLAWVRALIRGLEKKLIGGTRDVHTRGVLNDLVMVEGYLHNRGASKKMLLEHLALTLPSSR